MTLNSDARAVGMRRPSVRRRHLWGRARRLLAVGVAVAVVSVVGTRPTAIVEAEAAVADLAFSLQTSKSLDGIGRAEEFELTATVTNHGPDPVMDAQSRSVFANLRVMSGAPDHGVMLNPLGQAGYVWSIGPLAAGETATFTMVVRVLKADLLSIQASAWTESGEIDPDGSNNAVDPPLVGFGTQGDIPDVTPPGVSVSHYDDGGGLWVEISPLPFPVQAGDSESTIASIDCTASTDGAPPVDLEFASSLAHSSGSGVEVTADGVTTVTCTATDAAGNTSEPSSATGYKDASGPVLGPCPAAGPFPVGSGQHSIGPIAADDPHSGIYHEYIFERRSAVIDTGQAGYIDVFFQAFNNAEVGSHVTCRYLVGGFEGFTAPVDSAPTINTARAGQSIPVSFTMGGSLGLNIFEAGYPLSRPVACDTGAVQDPVEQTVAANSSGLQYDPQTQTYKYVWKTTKSADWVGCRELVLRFIGDPHEHIAKFSFR